MRESERFGKVKYWAPFVLIGEDVMLEFGATEYMPSKVSRATERACRFYLAPRAFLHVKGKAPGTRFATIHCL